MLLRQELIANTGAKIEILGSHRGSTSPGLTPTATPDPPPSQAVSPFPIIPFRNAEIDYTSEKLTFLPGLLGKLLPAAFRSPG